MMDTAKSVDLLNEAVADELKAVHQYMYWHFHLDDQGFPPLASLLRKVAIMEMGHIEMLAERILFLKGEVEMVAGGPVEKITEPDAIVKRAAEMEQEAITMYNESALKCSQLADAASKQLFESLVNDEEGHYDQFDTQVDNIARFGPSYLALQSFGTASEEAGGEE
jgi:bacterioferritin